MTVMVPPGNVPAIGFSDARLKVGAYIADEKDLYEVVGVVRTNGGYLAGAYLMKVENCRNLAEILLPPQKIRESFELVRAAPKAIVPDDVEHIAWGAA